MTGSIICGIDGSPDARAALRVAAALSGRLGSRLVVVYVAQPPTTGRLATAPDAGEIDAAVEFLERLVLDESVGAERRVAFGLPAEGIADLAEEEGADLIVVGSRGRSAVKAAFFGSVSSDLIGVARCPVVVVPPKRRGRTRRRNERTTLPARPRRKP